MKYRNLLPVAVTTLGALLCSPALASSILLSSEEFALLGGTTINGGATVGTIISNGDIGLSPGLESAIVNFNPPGLLINGEIVETGAVTEQARLDLIKAMGCLAGMPSDVNMSNVDLGGKTLAPGVYTFDGAATLTGDLVLDGQGKDNVFWVFQIATSLTTAVDSTVTVINPGPNGGSDYGVYWNAGAEIIVGATNAVLGNYLSGTSITFGANSDASGRALALAAITLDQNELNAFGGPNVSDWTGGNLCSSTKLTPDFNHDGKPDLLWHHQVNGNLAAWLMDGLNLQSVAYFSPLKVNASEWQVQGLGYFNGDKQSDLLWQNQLSGSLVVWMMNGTSLLSPEYLSPYRVSDLNWKVTGVGDFRGGGSSDLLWRNRVNGGLIMWEMDGVNLENGEYLSISTVSDLNWSVRAIADFNGDCKSDIVWQNIKDGRLLVWFMDGPQVLSSGLFSVEKVTGLDWRIMGAGDYNADGENDLIWWNKTSGKVFVWYLNGMDIQSTSYTTPNQLTDTNWSIRNR